ncbi:MAG: hypothetical protein AVDCRST_MAG69-2777, partial [uncultured Solirubrobacteraceae bacterium]
MTGLSADERSLLRTAAREALRERDWLTEARDALDGEPPSDSWPIAMAAGWPGLLVSEADGGAGLGPAEALLVMRELGRELAGVPLIGHLMATALLATPAPPGTGSAPLARAIAAGERRAAWLPARVDAAGGISVDPIEGPGRAGGPRIDERDRVTASVGWVPDAPGAHVLVCSAADGDGRPCTALIPASEESVEEVASYDGSRRLGHVHLREAPATRITTPVATIERTWALAQALVGAESLGAAERLLEMSVAHARSRFAFGRAIGSFQAIKHQLVEVLRRIDNARALAGRAGTSLAADDSDAYSVACALRFSAGYALDFAARAA